MNHARILLNLAQILFTGSEVCPRLCISNKLPGAAEPVVSLWSLSSKDMGAYTPDEGKGIIAETDERLKTAQH